MTGDRRSRINPRPEWLPEHLFPFETRHVDLEGHRIHLLDVGPRSTDGPTLFFVHGNPDWMFLWRGMIQRLQVRFRCVAFDLPGFGFSEATKGYEYTPAEHARVTADLLEKLDLRRVIPVLHDWGGPIGLWAAAERVSRISGLVITATLAWPDYGRSQPWYIRLMMRMVTGPKGRTRILEKNVAVEGVLKYNMKRDGRPPSNEIQDAYRGPFLEPESRHPTWVFPNWLFGGEGHQFLMEVERRCKAVLNRMPTLLVFGDKDLTNRVSVELPRFQSMFPTHETAILKGAMHFFPETHAEEAAEALQTWLAGHDRLWC